MRSKRSTVPEFISLISRFDNDIDLLRAHCNETINDPEGSKNALGNDEFEKKFKLGMELNQNMAYTIFMPFVNYYKFRKKCIEDGYSIQEGLNRLIEAFVEGKLVVKED